MTLRLRLLAIAVSLPLASAAHAAPADSGWDWIVAPYGWAASIGTNLRTFSPPSSSSSDTAFKDVVDKLDGVFQVHAEGQGDAFGAFADFTYFGLADAGDRPGFHTETDLDMRLLDAAFVWSPGVERFQGLETFAGVRFVDLDFTAHLAPTDPAYPLAVVDDGKSFTDFLLGARYSFALGERWGLTLRGDGSWGDTAGTWNASAIAQYRTAIGAWAFGYRYLDIDLEPGNDRVSIQLSGPMVGYAFRF